MLNKFYLSVLCFGFYCFISKTLSASFDPLLRVQLLEQLKGGSSGIELSQIYQQALLRRFSQLTEAGSLLKDNPCILFAVGSVGRVEAVYGSDLEAGLFCKKLLEPQEIVEVAAALNRDAPDLIWDSEFTLIDNVYSPDSMSADVRKMFPSKLLKLMDASPIAYLNCSPESFSFASFRDVVWGHIRKQENFEYIAKTAELQFEGDFWELRNTVDEVVRDHITGAPLDSEEVLNLDHKSLRDLLFLGISENYQTETPIIYSFDLKHSIYRPITLFIAMSYLNLCRLGEIQCGPEYWKTNTNERLHEILSNRADYFDLDLTRVMNVFLSLRMGTKILSDTNVIGKLDYKDHYFFESVPEVDVFDMFIVLIQLQKQSLLPKKAS